MRRALIRSGAAVAVAAVAFWAAGGLAMVEHWAVSAQREAQNALAGAIRALRAGETGALAGLLAVAFGYGFFHAAGPGHGKFLIGGYGMARRVPMLKLGGIALAASLAQATVAVVLVYGGIAALGWTRADALEASERLIAPAGLAVIGLVGLWLVLRGGQAVTRRMLVAAPALAGEHGHGDRHHGAGHCESCGHAHGPDPEAAARVTGWRDAAMLIAGVALRPCSGAVMLLALCWSMGIAAAGVAGAYAMAVGTAAVTVSVAIMAVWAREGTLTLPGLARLRIALPLIEIVLGTAILVWALGLLIAG